MVKYNLPTNATENITGVYSLFQYAQEVSDNYFVLALMLAIFVITFVASKRYSTSKAFAVAAFINMILSIISRTLGFISNKWMFLSIILVGVAIVWLHKDSTSSF